MKFCFKNFDNMFDLMNFVNEKNITKENIQQIVSRHYENMYSSSTEQ